jgi:hypothetical protein
MAGYPSDKTAFLISGFKQGFKLGYEGDYESFFSPNLKSADEMPDVTERKLAKELSKGRIALLLTRLLSSIPITMPWYMSLTSRPQKSP